MKFKIYSSKVPPRPAGQRTEPEPNTTFQGFGFGDGGFQMSLGIGAFPFGIFTSTFNFGANLRSQSMCTYIYILIEYHTTNYVTRLNVFAFWPQSNQIVFLFNFFSFCFVLFSLFFQTLVQLYSSKKISSCQKHSFG